MNDVLTVINSIAQIQHEAGCLRPQAWAALEMCDGDVRAAIELAKRMSPLAGLPTTLSPSPEVLSMMYGPCSGRPKDHVKRVKAVRDATGASLKLSVNAQLMCDHDVGESVRLLRGSICERACIMKLQANLSPSKKDFELMTLPGETVGTGGPGPEQDPNIVGPKVMKSAAGYYVGYGYIESYGEVPYSRESGYYQTSEQAQAALPSFIETPDPADNFHARGTQFDPQGLEDIQIDDESPSMGF